MNATTHVYTTIVPHPTMGDTSIDPEALAAMRQRSLDWPDCRWAAAQCVDLSSPNLGHLKFAAVGPGRGIPCVTAKCLFHWSYYFVGWVNLETGKIQPEVP
jgi:hypothetical protein